MLSRVVESQLKVLISQHTLAIRGWRGESHDNFRLPLCHLHEGYYSCFDVVASSPSIMLVPTWYRHGRSVHHHHSSWSWDQHCQIDDGATPYHPFMTTIPHKRNDRQEFHVQGFDDNSSSWLLSLLTNQHWHWQQHSQHSYIQLVVARQQHSSVHHRHH